MGTFLKYTVGLECNRARIHGTPIVNRDFARKVKVGVERNDDGSVTLEAVSAENLASLGQKHQVTAAEYEGRPVDPYDGTVEARWALSLLGWSLMHDDFEAARQRR